MKISIRSRTLIAIGTLIYGDPKGFGIPCSAAEFYALPNERPITNPRDFHPSHASSWNAMRRNLFIDLARRRVFKHLAICAFVASAAIYTGGSLLTAGIVKTKSVASSLSAKLDSKEAKQKRIEEVKKEAEELTRQANAGTVSKDEYDRKAAALQKEFKTLQENL